MTTLARLLIAVATTLIPVSALAQAPIGPLQSQPPTAVRLACFSLQRAFSESADGKAAIARLTALQDEKARAIAEKNKALQAQEQALQQSTPLLSEAARTQRSNELERFRIDVQRFIQDAQAELMGVQRDTENAFLVRLKPAVEKVAKDKGLQMIFNLDEGLIAWTDPSLDITSDVVKQLALK
jgi:Skp family chaperone for outer membrane proteins